MPENTFEHLWSEISTALLNYYLYNFTDKPISQDGRFHQKYIELFIKTYEIFDNYVFFHNPYNGELDKINFTKEFLRFCDQTADLTVNYYLINEREKINETNENRLQREQQLQTFAPITDKSSNEEITGHLNILRKMHKDASIDIEVRNRKIEKFFLNMVLSVFKRFIDLFLKCNSSLKEAFIIGFLSYPKEMPAWALLNNVKHYDGMFNVYAYEFDFIIQNNEERIKIAIKLDDNDYYERPESQNAIENINDRTLIKQGWEILRFHQNEIEKNIKSAIKQVSQVYNGKERQ